MTTRVQIDASEFDVTSLKQKANIDAELNRNKYVEQSRIRETKKRAEKLRKVDSKDSAAGSALAAQRSSLLPVRRKTVFRPDELSATLFGDSTRLLHLRIGRNSSQTVIEKVAYPGTVVVPRPFGRPPFNFVGVYYYGITGVNRISLLNSLGLSIRVPRRSTAVNYEVRGSVSASQIPVYDSISRVGGGGNSLNIGSLILPVGGKTCVVIIYSRAASNLAVLRAGPAPNGPPSSEFVSFFNPWRIGPVTGIITSTSGSRESIAYVCNEEKIREIPIPGRISEIIDLINPAPTTMIAEADGTNFDGGEDFYFEYTTTVLPTGAGFDPSSSFSTGFYREGLSVSVDAWTPSIFNALNQLSIDNGNGSIFSTGLLRSFPIRKKWVLPDSTKGWWKDYVESIPGQGDAVAYYGQWRTPNQKPSSLITGFSPLQSATFREPSGSTFLSSLPANTDDTITVVWDWDDPAYCRSLCLDLGFSEANLTP